MLSKATAFFFARVCLCHFYLVSCVCSEDAALCTRATGRTAVPDLAACVILYLSRAAMETPLHGLLLCLPLTPACRCVTPFPANEALAFGAEPYGIIAPFITRTSQ